MTEPVRLAAVPQPLHWAATPASWSLDGQTLTIAAGPRTDLFVDPWTGAATLTGPRLLTPLEADFQFSARVRVGFADSFDAGGLVVWLDDRTWAKLCFERSPQGQPMVVSVVTRSLSDDANGFAVDGSTLWLRISRIAASYAFHASTNGAYWHMVRQFTLGAYEGPVGAGFEAQSPMGAGCAAVFDAVRCASTTLGDLRDGS
jgi:regulation of enolase protein 1 (concanavalin A-like superfamily)